MKRSSLRCLPRSLQRPHPDVYRHDLRALFQWSVDVGLTVHHAPEPAALHLGEMAHQAKKRHRGRFDGAGGQLGGTELRALQLNIWRCQRRRSLSVARSSPRPGYLDPRILAGFDKHVSAQKA